MDEATVDPMNYLYAELFANTVQSRGNKQKHNVGIVATQQEEAGIHN